MPTALAPPALLAARAPAPAQRGAGGVMPPDATLAFAAGPLAARH